MEIQAYLIYLFTSAIIVLSPGPTAILVVSQAASNGWRASTSGIVGIIIATAIYFGLTATGLASLIYASHFAFLVVKWTGVVFLIYLGVSAIFSSSSAHSIEKGDESKPLLSLFIQGFIVEFANPKALIFFAAILPQFINLNSSIAPQLFIMGLTGAILQLVIYSVYALIGDRIAKGGIKAWVVDLIKKLAGGALIFAGVKMVGVTAQR